MKDAESSVKKSTRRTHRWVTNWRKLLNRSTRDRRWCWLFARVMSVPSGKLSPQFRRTHHGANAH